MSDRVFIITGAARGIGFACAQRLVDDGHRVVLADRDTEAGLASGKDLAADTDRAIFVECDVSDPLSVHNLVAETLGAYDRIDGLINNAGIAVKGGALDMSIEDFDRNLAVNLRGAFLVSKAVAKYMVEEIENRADRSRLTDRPYAIVNMSSINDTVAIPDYLAYTISKGPSVRRWAVRGFPMKSLLLPLSFYLRKVVILRVNIFMLMVDAWH